MTDSWIQDPQVREDRALRSFLDELAATATHPIDPAVRAATLEAMLVEAATRATPPPAPSWRRRARRVLAMTGVKVVLAGSVAAAATTGGMAATGTLPAPAQQFAHEVGAHLGIGIPAAPGQAKKQDGNPDSTGRDHAPGQLKKKTSDDPGTGRDHAPGQVGRDEVPPGSEQQDAPPPGLERQDRTPPGLEKQDDVPAGPRDGQDGKDGKDAAQPPDTGPPDETSAGASDEPPPDLADEPGRSGSAPGQVPGSVPRDAGVSKGGAQTSARDR